MSRIHRTNKYDLMGLLREELKKKSLLQIHTQDNLMTTQLKEVSAAGFTTDLDISDGKKLSFTIFSENGKANFFSRRKKGVADSIGTLFNLPDSITIIQRRAHPRLATAPDYPFFCHGRFRNGKNYHFAIDNLSCGGCGLIAHQAFSELKVANLYLKQAILNLGAYGEIIVDLAIKNIYSPPCFGRDSRVEYRISCQFIFRHEDDKQRMEDLMLELTINEKRKKRVMPESGHYNDKNDADARR
ncbi:TPA: flagellar brake protein [Raoultella ornithinolytica]